MQKKNLFLFSFPNESNFGEARGTENPIHFYTNGTINVISNLRYIILVVYSLIIYIHVIPIKIEIYDISMNYSFIVFTLNEFFVNDSNIAIK